MFKKFNTARKLNNLKNKVDKVNDLLVEFNQLYKKNKYGDTPSYNSMILSIPPGSQDHILDKKASKINNIIRDMKDTSETLPLYERKELVFYVGNHLNTPLENGAETYFPWAKEGFHLSGVHITCTRIYYDNAFGYC